MIATLLGQSESAIENLIGALSDDPQVDFIRTLWGETFPRDEDEDEDEDEEA